MSAEREEHYDEEDCCSQAQGIDALLATYNTRRQIWYTRLRVFLPANSAGSRLS